MTASEKGYTVQAESRREFATLDEATAHALTFAADTDVSIYRTNGGYI